MTKFTNKWKRSEEIIYINCHNQNSKHWYSFRLEICHKMWIEVWQVFSGLIKVRTVFITNLFLVFCPQCIVTSSSSQEINSYVQVSSIHLVNNINKQNGWVHSSVFQNKFKLHLKNSNIDLKLFQNISKDIDLFN